MSTEQLTGKDIIALGYQQGPSVGIILREANAALENGMQMDVVKSIVAALPTKYADFLDTQFKETAAYWKTFHQQNEEEKK